MVCDIKEAEKAWIRVVQGKLRLEKGFELLKGMLNVVEVEGILRYEVRVHWKCIRVHWNATEIHIAKWSIETDDQRQCEDISVYIKALEEDLSEARVGELLNQEQNQLEVHHC